MHATLGLAARALCLASQNDDRPPVLWVSPALVTYLGGGPITPFVLHCTGRLANKRLHLTVAYVARR